MSKTIDQIVKDIQKKLHHIIKNLKHYKKLIYFGFGTELVIDQQRLIN